MRSLALPTHNAASVLELCAKHVRDGGYARRLTSVTAEIAEAEKEYKTKGKASALFTIPTATTVANRVTGKEMATLYTVTLSGKRSPIRYIYDEIKSAPRNGICPLCGQRIVSTLDHYLAKSLHPSLAITPLNLVPACADCNKAKHDMQPTNASEQTLHPYFDEADSSVWLFARVVKTEPPALRFLAVPPTEWTHLKQERLIVHFKTFQLSQLYSSYAAEELLNISFRLLKVATGEGSEGVRRYLGESAESFRRISKNSWQVAMYDALGESEWFCSDGFRVIAKP